MSKSKEKTGAADPVLDYQQLAEHMLTGWQEQWRQFATNKDNPFASNFAVPNIAGDWLSTWSNAMAGWTPASSTSADPTSGPSSHAPQSAPPAPKPEESSPHVAASQSPAATTTPSAATSDARPAAPVSAPAAAASSARDVLLTELARRVEFLHERVVALESELDKLKCGKPSA